MPSASIVDGIVAAVATAAALYYVGGRTRARVKPKPGLSDAVFRLLQHGRRKLIANMLDLGSFFGADIGGSLTKLVLFVPDAGLVDWLMKRAPREHVEAAHWSHKMESIDVLQRFILSRQSYGRTGVRDAHLEVHVKELGGSFHFIR